MKWYAVAVCSAVKRELPHTRQGKLCTGFMGATVPPQASG